MEFVDIERSKKRLKNIIFFGFLIIYSILVVYLSYKINISEDETYTLNTTSRNLSGVIRQSYDFEGQPPFYFILLSLWRHFNHGIFFAKLFSLVCIGLSAFSFYRLVKYFAGTECAKWLLIIFLLNPFTVWAALEMRTYALLIFLSTLSVYFFFRYYFENNNKFLYAFLLFSVIGIYTQYFFLFLIASFAITILAFKGWKKFFIFCLYLLPVIVVFLPNLFFLPSQINLMKSNSSQLFSLSLISNIIYTPLNLTLAINQVSNVWINRLLRLCFYSASLYIYLKLLRNYLIHNDSFLKKYNVVLFTIPLLIVFFCIGFEITNVGYNHKYMVVVFPVLMLLFIIFKNYSTILRNVIYISISLYFIILLTKNYRHPVKTYDYISVANFIQKIELPNQPILIYRPAIALPFKYYYTGKNKIIPIPYPVRFDSSFLINIKDTNELKQSIENIKTTSNSYIMLSDTTIFESDLTMNREMVSEFINEHYKVTLDTLYKGWGKEKSLRIREFEKNKD
ncbi:MAG: glycosyltransferase family 39 protein [Ginsengibacter sp.]